MSWEEVELGSVTTINPRLPKGTDEGQIVSFLGMKNVLESGELFEPETRVLSEIKKGFTYFEREDILLAKITPCFENGKACYTKDLPYQIGYGSTEFHVLRVIPEKLNPKYLFFLIWNNTFRFHGEHAMIGAAGQKRIGTDFLKSFKIPLPPLPIQKKIAEALEKADRLRQLRQEQLNKLDELLQSTFLDMFGDPVTNPKGWEVRKLSEIGEWTSGGTPKRSIKEYFTGELNWFSAGELNTKYIEESKEKITEIAVEESSAKLRPIGSLFVGMYDTAAFKLSILTKESCSNQACANVIPNGKVDVSWLFHALTIMREHFLSRRNGVRQKNLSLGMIKGFEIYLPHIELQREFSKITESIEVEIHAIKNVSVHSDNLFNSLMQKAFKGELEFK